MKIKIKIILLITFIGLGFTGANQTAKAFIPYVYVPNSKTLVLTSIEIGKIAEKFIYFGEKQEALKLAELAVRLNPSDDRLWSLLAQSQIINNQLIEAQESLKEAKAINPEKSSIWFAEGSLAIMQRETQEAIELINQGLELDPENASAYFQLGNARLIQVEPDLALRAFEKATYINPTFWEAKNNQGLVLYEMGKKESAIEVWREVLQISKNAEPMLALAAALNDLEPFNSESIELARKALATNPNYVYGSYQEEQLWGLGLRAVTKILLESPALYEDVQRAIANATIENGF